MAARGVTQSCQILRGPINTHTHFSGLTSVPSGTVIGLNNNGSYYLEETINTEGQEENTFVKETHTHTLKQASTVPLFNFLVHSLPISSSDNQFKDC